MRTESLYFKDKWLLKHKSFVSNFERVTKLRICTERLMCKRQTLVSALHTLDKVFTDTLLMKCSWFVVWVVVVEFCCTFRKCRKFRKVSSVETNINGAVCELSLSAARLICVLCIYNTVCPCFITTRLAWRAVGWVALASLKLPDRALGSFCKTVIGALQDNMQGPPSALGHVDLDLKQNKRWKVCREGRNKCLQIAS